MREKRNALTPHFRETASEKIVDQFKQIKHLENYHHIGLYMAFDGEMDLKNIIAYCRENNKTLFLPILHPEKKVLRFCEYRSDEKLVPNRFGILEPGECQGVEVSQLDMVLLPLTAFDKAGHRLGMGQGYYDHTLKDVVRVPANPLPLYIGVGYAFQEVEPLAPHPHDVRLDGVLTEEGFWLTKS